MRLTGTILLLIFSGGWGSSLRAQSGVGFEEQGKPIYHVTFVQAKPGKDREYRKFARQVFQPMWEEAVKTGIIESWSVYEHPIYFGSNVGYTHIQIVKFKNFAAFDAFIPNLLKVVEKKFPGRDLQREAEALMDIVKSDIFHQFASTTEPGAGGKAAVRTRTNPPIARRNESRR